MKKYSILLILTCLFYGFSIAQSTIREARRKSWQTLVYTIPADSAAYYYTYTIKNPDAYLNQEPFAVWPADSVDLDNLPVGNYLILAVTDNKLEAQIFNQSNIRAMPVNNERRLQLEVKNADGRFLPDARLWIGKREWMYNPANHSFTIPYRKPDDKLIRIAVPGDTVFMQVTMSDQVYNPYKGAWSQWWKNFSNTKPGWILSTPVRKVKKMIKNPPRYWFRRRYRSKNRAGTRNGYILFNKPKYLPGDSVKVKAFILNRKKKQVKKSLEVYLDYYKNNKPYHDRLATVKPYAPSGFVYEFVPGDSLEVDREYSLSFENKKKVSLMRGRFKLEDYLLDEVTSYDLRLSADAYYRGDSIRIFAHAKDANGLGLMDGRVRLFLLTGQVGHVYPNQEYVPDTLWQEEKKSAPEGETIFTVSTRSFPQADMSIKASLQFLNSNNEIQEESRDIRFYTMNDKIDVKEQGGFLTAGHMVNGVSVSSPGWMKEGDEKIQPIRFPYTRKINPYAEDYSFYIKDDTGKIIQYASFSPEERYTVSFRRLQLKDTSGFILYNPYRVPVHYTIGYGSAVIAEGADTTEYITWKSRLNKGRSYTVQWNYIWAGEERKMKENLGVLDKLLETTIQGAEVIYPGQTDTLTVRVQNYKGIPARNVNLTAVSYNSQFQKDIHVAEPPYLDKFHFRRRIYMNDYELEDAGFYRKFLLGEHPAWRTTFGLDTMLYYQFLFPSDTMMRKAEYTGDYLPQLAIYVVKKGVPQEIYMLYLNREFAYYNGVKDRSPYSFSVYPGYVKAGIRLKDRYIEIDSIYAQPFYKQDIVFDLDRLPARATSYGMPDYYTPIEKNTIQSQIWQLKNDYRTNNGYIWQGTRLFYLDAGSNHLAGPFKQGDSLQFFKPGSFDIKFPFESNYQYQLTPKMVRLERNYLLLPGTKNYLPDVSETVWRLGDTLRPAPEIRYDKPKQPPFVLKQTDYVTNTPKGNLYGSLEIEMPADSTFRYAVLYDVNNSRIPKVKINGLRNFHMLNPGKYKLILVTSGFSFLETAAFEIKGNGLNYLRVEGTGYRTDNSYIKTWVEKQWDEEKDLVPGNARTNSDYTKDSLYVNGQKPAASGNGGLQGVIKDERGNEPLVGATIMIKGSSTAVSTDRNGNFTLPHIKPGRYTLVIASVGYAPKEIQVFAGEGIPENVDISLRASESALNEVVVIGYGISRKKDMTGSVSILSADDLSNSLQGKVAGISIDGYAGAGSSIRIRGLGSLTGNQEALYVVNGVLMDKVPEGISLEGAEVNILKGSAAASLYGNRAANGVVVITTGDFIPKSLRQDFKDDAFWKPKLLTDKNGEARFAVTYPDNITGWQTFVVGMDKKRRITKSTFFTKSFKPLLARLSTPSFLIEGDSANLVGKTINYTTAPSSVRSSFITGEEPVVTGTELVESNGSVIESLPVVAVTGTDTLSVQYTVTNASGYSDGELRKIPVFRKGTEEARGLFTVLDRDTSFSIMPGTSAAEVVLYARNNSLDVLLNEIAHLKEYPYYCMEQTASKLTGLLMEKKIMEALKKPFRDQKDIRFLLARLQKSQLYNGGWGWWQDGDASLAITRYVVQSLLPLRNDPVVESNIRNGLLYLQNHLLKTGRGQLVSVLYTLSEAAHYMNYDSYLQTIPFDSLTLHQQWQVVKIKQQQGLPFNKELSSLMKEKQQTMTGGVYWGVDNYNWESNSMATTVIAFKVLERMPAYQSLLKNMIQFFLERRNTGYWTNTVESARVTDAILPEVLKQQRDFTSPASLRITGDSVVVMNTFPFRVKLKNNGRPLQVTKSGGGMVYFTAWQQLFNNTPEPVNDHFSITSVFERNDQPQIMLKGGEKVNMKVKITAREDAEYVKIDIPIPAGCTYSEKKNEDPMVHREFYKDRVEMFVEHMKTGTHEFVIELEPRYGGTYQLNPVKAALMYFPVLFGRNSVSEIKISNQ